LFVFSILGIIYFQPFSPFHSSEIAIKHNRNRKIFLFSDKLPKKAGYYKHRKNHIYRLLREFLILGNKNNYLNLGNFVFSTYFLIVNSVLFFFGANIFLLRVFQGSFTASASVFIN
jgi:hypothetical protein